MNTAPVAAPEFVRIDPAEIEADLVKRYERMTGKTLYPAQIERLYIHQIAYALALALTAIQSTAEKMLVRFSSGGVLDFLGELVGTPRLPAAAAQTDITFTLNEPTNAPVMVPIGTVIASTDARVNFVTDEVVNVGANPVTVTATCTEPGALGNGWLPDQINALQSNLPITASNITTSAGGADIETDERYKTRIMSAPEAYTNAGSYGAYRHHAMSAHQSIVDVAVYGPSEGEPPGRVALYPLTESGLPSDTLLAQVAATVSDERVRPLTDIVHVRSPEAVEYTITATLIFYLNADRVAAMQRAQSALDEWLAVRQHTLGLDLVPEQISAILHVPGVYQAQVISPAFQVLDAHQWGRCTGITLTDGGTAHG